jgi:hypothetical protein
LRWVSKVLSLEAHRIQRGVRELEQVEWSL